MKNFKNTMRMPKDAGWLIPGLQVKRWFVLIFLGAILMGLGFLILCDIKPIFYTMEFIRKIAMNISTEWIAFAVIMFGAAIFFKGWKQTNLSILDINNSRDDSNILEALYRRRKLNRGPKIVAIGGGTGLSMLLKGIKHITNNITAVVTVGDDGLAASGRLREDMGYTSSG